MTEPCSDVIRLIPHTTPFLRCLVAQVMASEEGERASIGNAHSEPSVTRSPRRLARQLYYGTRLAPADVPGCCNRHQVGRALAINIRLGPLGSRPRASRSPRADAVQFRDLSTTPSGTSLRQKSESINPLGSAFDGSQVT